MDKFEKTKRELDRMKNLNSNLRRKLNQNSIDFSDFQDNSDNEDDQYVQKKPIKTAEIGISRASSLISLT